MAVPVFALAPALPVFVAAMVLYGVALGMVDATTNMQGVALEHRYGRPILPSFHGAWTLGGLVGAGVPLVRRLAHRFAGHGEGAEDLAQVGALALVRAIDRHDPARAARTCLRTSRNAWRARSGGT